MGNKSKNLAYFFIEMALIIFLLQSNLFSMQILGVDFRKEFLKFRGTRVIRGKEASKKPVDVLKNQGYYIKPQAQEKVDNLDVKLVSFDWGGVLSPIVSNEKMRDEVRKLLSTLKEEGVKVTIITEGDVELISRKLKDLNLKHYFDGIYQSIPNELAITMGNVGLTKGEILKSVGEDYNLKKNKIVPFDDNPDYIHAFNYKGFHTVGVVSRATKDSEYDRLAKKMLEAVDVTVSHLGIRIDKILKILNIQKE